MSRNASHHLSGKFDPFRRLAQALRRGRDAIVGLRSGTSAARPDASQADAGQPDVADTLTDTLNDSPIETVLDPFAAAVHAARTSADTDSVIHALHAHAVKLMPLVKRRMYAALPGVPDGLQLGWAQLPSGRGETFSIGLFSGRDEFSQIAIADGKGRVFVTTNPNADTHDMDPRFLFAKEDELTLTDGPRLGHPAPARGEEQVIKVIQGGIVGRDNTGRMTWLASWLKHDNRYTIEQLRANLPASMRHNLEYRDAIAIAFLTTYMLPQMNGLLIGFGSGNIFRRLNREAPIGAIRRSVRDTLEARAHGLRASGLEDHFAQLMDEAGALDITPGLEALHGAEPLHLYTSSYSGGYFFTWDSGLEFSAALKSLRIEGNLNRFASVSAWIERAARSGSGPTEDTVTCAQAAQIDLALLENPSLLALPWQDPTHPVIDPLRDDGSLAIQHLFDYARATALDVAAHNPAPVPVAATSAAPDSYAAGTDASIAEQNGSAEHEGDAENVGGNENVHDAENVDSTNSADRSEWLYRQSLALLMRRLRVPYRFDTEFRADLRHGRTAIAFTTAGMTMMPTSRYDERTHGWVTLSDAQRVAMSADYNLRVGLMLATLAFGANPNVREVSVHIDSIGLEEAVAEQNSAIASLMSDALRSFEQLHTSASGISGAKAGPKDGDYHGDPTGSSTPKPEPPESADAAQSGHNSQGSHSGNNAAHNGRNTSNAHDAGNAHNTQREFDSQHGHDEGQGAQGETTNEPVRSSSTRGEVNEAKDERDVESLDQRFADLMKDVNLDESVFGDASISADDARNADDTKDMNSLGGFNAADFDDTDSAASADSGNDMMTDDMAADPLEALRRNPTVRNLVTVTFTRDTFLKRLSDDALRHPRDTYAMFDAVMTVDSNGGLAPSNAEFDLHDARFSPNGSQEEPELSDRTFPPEVARVLGTSDAIGLSIQRADLLQRGVDEFHRLAADTLMPSARKAQQAIKVIERIADPELTGLSTQVASAFIDGEDTPDIVFHLADDLDRERAHARDLLFSGQAAEAVQTAENVLEHMDAVFADNPGVPRYFNSYAERVVYNRLFATSGEHTVLIPDNLFYAHTELAELLAQLKGPKAALPHLNAMVSYAPAYPLSHMKLAVQLARNEDWDSARAACLNALRVALDRDDAAFAYYRFAYAEWMRDEFDVAVAAYIMSRHIAPGHIPSLDDELQELAARAESQCVPIPSDVDEAAALLAAHDLPVWPHTEVAAIVRDAARVCVDNGMFVPARTLSVAAARMNEPDNGGFDMVQAQFARSLSS